MREMCAPKLNRKKKIQLGVIMSETSHKPNADRKNWNMENGIWKMEHKCGRPQRQHC